MMKQFKVLLVLLMITSISYAQKQLTLEQAVLQQATVFRPKTLNGFSWRPGTSEYTYIVNDSLIAVNTKDLKQKNIITLTAVNSILKNSGIAPIKQLFPIWLSSSRILLKRRNTIAILDVVNHKVEAKFVIPDDAKGAELSPDAKRVSYLKGSNLFMMELNGNEIAVTNDSVDGFVNGQSVHRNEFGISKGTFWSPSGRYLAYYHMNESMVTQYPLVDITKRVGEAVFIRYPMAGMKSHEVTVRIYDTQTGNTTEMQTGEPREQYLTNLAWTPDEKSILIAILNREQNHLKMNTYRVIDGAYETTLFEEVNEKYVEPLMPVQFMKSGEQFLWLSRRDGWNHIYLYGIDGKLIKQVTNGNWEITEVHAVDESNGLVYFTATKDSPLDRHLYSVNIKDGKLQKLTQGEGTHRPAISPDYKYFVDFYSSINVPNRVGLFTISGKSIHQLIDAPNPYNGYAVPMPQLMTIQKADGTELYGRLIKPTLFDSTKRYPVVVYVYGGPHSQLVTNSWMGGARLWECYMANLGYIMFTLDNRGTSNRGAEFEQVIHRQLGAAELEDQLLGLKFLKTLPFVDSTRIGVHGWSFGGFMTITMMLRASEQFKVGVAGGPVTDWKFYEVMYGERYMDTPQQNPDGYSKADLKNYVKNLKGKLLIIHDDMDKTVVPQHSLTLIHEFVKNSVQVDFFMYPQHDHNVYGKDRVHLINKIINYFNDNL